MKKHVLRNKRQTKTKQKRGAVIAAAFQTSLTRRPYQEFKAGSVYTSCTFLPFYLLKLNLFEKLGSILISRQNVQTFLLKVLHPRGF